MQSPRHAGLPEKPTYTIEEKEKVREVHNESSAQMIKESITKPKLSLGLENCREYASYIAKVSKYHRKLDLQEMKDTSIGGKAVRLQLLAALLRLGDALDADYRRVNMTYLSLREMPVESKYHWWCHHYVQSVLIQKGHIKIYFRFPEEYKNDEVINVIKRRVRESISKAFLEVYDILYENEFRLYREIEVGEETYLSKGSLQAIPDDLHEFIEENVLRIAERSEQESGRTGLVWHVDGVPFSDDIAVVKYLSRVFTLVKEERYLDAAEEIEECRLLTMTPKDRMIFLNTAGNCYFVLGRLDDAESYYKDALRLSERRDLQEVYGEDVGHARSAAYGNIGLVYRDKGNLDEALKYHKEALEIDRQIGYKVAEAIQLGGIGVVCRNRGDLDEALRYSEDALKIYRQIGYKQGEANVLGNIGLIYNKKGDLDKALKYSEDALKIDRQIGYKQGEANVLGNIGLIYSDKGDLDQALGYLEEALEMHKEIGYKQGEANSLGNIGVVYWYRGDLDLALGYFREALEMHKEIGYKQGEAIQLENIGLVYGGKGNLDQALKYLKEALNILDQFGLTYGRENIEKAIEIMKNEK